MIQCYKENMSCYADIIPPKRYSIPGALKCLACHHLTPSLPQTLNLGYWDTFFNGLCYYKGS